MGLMSENRKMRLWLRAMELGAAGGCHQMPERSFFAGRWQLPVCARCLGLLCGWLLGLGLAAAGRTGPRAALWLLPMAADGSAQRLGLYNSTNPRRFATGLLAGAGWAALAWAGLRGFIRLLWHPKPSGEKL